MLKNVIQKTLLGKIFVLFYLTCYTPALLLALRYQTELAIRGILIATFFLGVLIAARAIALSKNQYKSKIWSEAKTNLIDCHVRKRRSRTKNVYRPVVKYEFWVKDRRYIGENINFSPKNNSKRNAYSTIKYFQKRAGNLCVYYNTENPSINALETDSSSANVINIWLGVSLSAIAVLLLVKDVF